ncbi:M15 family metallopeptidase ['Paenibacillus yunnanensis' Narsing Rao et al. 2020]|uniref:M15 family metallopeptidase n=1 Tax=Paenibacillus tengchongensis TaxID=2608684 RepID=UPI00124EF9B7|nr:M15 family metallopeptidase [Paenibacillus tengchongensis]
MRKWVFWLTLLLLLAADALHDTAGSAGKVRELADSGALMTSGTGSNELLAIGKSQIYRGNLVLVNRDYPVHPEGVTGDVVQLSGHRELLYGYGLLDNSIRLSERVAERFVEMVEAAGRDGVSQFLISSGYRSPEEQEQLYADKGSDYALPPGYSEHNLGLSLDIGSSRQEMSRAPEGVWLRQHAAEFGFVLRYPQDKTGITGIAYEPWHFRYVGLPHSLIMQEKNFTLEEYLEFLKERKSYAATVGGKAYLITYHAVSGNTVIPVPADRRYELSGDNVGGVIVTIFPENQE